MATLTISVYPDSRNTIKQNKTKIDHKRNQNFWLRDKTKPICINAFGNFSGLVLNVEKTKAFWLGKWLNNRTKPLGMKWMNTPTKLLGIYVSYYEKGNN